MSSKFWTTGEERVLRECYVDGHYDWKRLYVELPNRSRRAIERHAGRMGLTVGEQKRNTKKYDYAKIARLFANGVSRAAVARRLGCSERTVTRAVAAMGAGTS